MSSVRIASYNLRDLKDDTLAATRVVRAIDPDILLLQECPRSWWGVWRTRLWVAAAGLWLPDRPHGSGGTSLAIRRGWSAAEPSHVALPVRRFARPRGYAAATVTAPGGERLTVASVHLSLNAAEREQHARQILAALPTHGSCVVAGDLNEGPHGAAWQLFAASFRDLAVDAGTVGPTFPAAGPQHRLDVIWGRGVRVTRGGLEPVIDEADLRRATDHRPVWVDVQVTGPGSVAAPGGS